MISSFTCSIRVSFRKEIGKGLSRAIKSDEVQHFNKVQVVNAEAILFHGDTAHLLKPPEWNKALNDVP